MALDLCDYDKKAREAIMAFWGNREKARQKQIEAGTVGQAHVMHEAVGDCPWDSTAFAAGASCSAKAVPAY